MFRYRLSLFSIIVRRIKDDWKLLSSVFVGIMIATTVAAATPVYLGALSQLSFEASLDRITNRILNGDVVAFDIPLSRKSIQSAEESFSYPDASCAGKRTGENIICNKRSTGF